MVNEGVGTTEGPIKDVRGDQDGVEGKGTVKGREVGDGERVGHEMVTDGVEQKAREKSVGVTTAALGIVLGTPSFHL